MRQLDFKAASNLLPFINQTLIQQAKQDSGTDLMLPLASSKDAALQMRV